MRPLAERLAELHDAGLHRRLEVLPGVELGANDSLGLADHPAVRAALMGALAEGLPAGSTGSRLLSGEHPAWRRLEARFARWQGREAALAFSTGHAANLGLLAALPEPGELVISDALNHASLIDGMRLSRARRRVVPHGDVAAVEAALAEAGGGWVVTESVFSMDGDLAPLPELVAACERHGGRLIVDEAHATGLFGPEGQGRVAALGLSGRVFATVHPCGKALGLCGALVCGDAELIDWLVNRARSFVFSTAPPPFLAAGLEAAMDLVRADPERRARPLALGDRLRRALADRVDTGGSQTHIVPLIVGEIEPTLRLARGLQARGWAARPIRPPTVPPGGARVRLSLSARLSEAQVDALAADILELLA